VLGWVFLSKDEEQEMLRATLGEKIRGEKMTTI